MPSVSSLLWAEGSGALASSISRWFCQKQRPRATPKTASETTTRARSSSRCSTRLTSSSYAIAFTRRIVSVSGVRVGGGVRLGCRRRAVGDATGGCSTASGVSSTSGCSPETEPRNSRIPLPTDLPSSGRRLGPKTTRAMTRTIMISIGPMFGTVCLQSWLGQRFVPAGPMSGGPAGFAMALLEEACLLHCA